MKPTFQPDVSLLMVGIVAVLNPAVAIVGLWLGWRCDQVQKLPIAGFAASLAGIALIWVGTLLRMPYLGDVSRSSAGMLVAQMVVGTLWAALGYALARRRAS
jgi:hypothetical protein